MNMKKWWLLFVVLFMQWSMNVDAQQIGNHESQTYSLKRLISSAIEKNFDVHANCLNDSLTLNEIKSLARNYQPKVTAGTSFSYWSWLQPNKEKMLGSGNTDMLIEISAYQLLYDWGVNRLQKQTEYANISINEQLRRQLKQNIAFVITQSYLDVQKQISRIEIYNTTILRLKDQLKVSENLYRIGKVSNLDLQKTRINIAIKERDLSLAKAMYAQLLSDLKHLSFVDSKVTIEDNDIELLYSTHKNLHQQYAKMQEHPSLKSFDEKIEQQKLQQELFKKQNRPEFFSYAATSWESSYIPFSKNFNYNIGVGIRYTLPFGGGRVYKENITKTNISLSQLEEQQKQTLSDLQKEIASTTILIDGKQIEVEQNVHIIQMADESLRNALILYEAGQENILNILDAQSIVTEQSIVYRETMIDYLILVAKLRYLQGTDTYPLD